MVVNKIELIILGGAKGGILAIKTVPADLRLKGGPPAIKTVPAIPENFTKTGCSVKEICKTKRIC